MVTKSEAKEILISELKPFPGNPNTHPKEQVEALMRSITKYTQYLPIVTDENYTMLRGHGTSMALKQLGYEKAKVLVLHGLTKKEKQKMVLEDNKIQSMSAIDYSAVEELIKEIGEHDIIGFSEDYLSTLFDEVKIDNQGVDFGIPQSQVSYTPSQSAEELNTQGEARGNFESGMSMEAPTAEEMPSHDAFQHHATAPIPAPSYNAPEAEARRVIICPHCGKEIAL